MKYCAIIPCYNEEQNVVQAYQRIKNSLSSLGSFEILFIDDGSTDKTLVHIKALARRDPRIQYISFSKNFGLEAAFTAGFMYSRAEWTIQFDCDLQSPPEEVYKLIAATDSGHDAVFALRKSRQDHWFRKLASWLQHKIATVVLGIEIPLGASVYRVIRTDVARKALTHHKGPGYFLASLPMVTNRYAIVETSHNKRLGGKSKWSSRKLVGHSIELFYGYSLRPVMYATVVMLLGAVLAAMGRFSFAATFALLAMSILIPYMARLVVQTHGRKQFLIRESNIKLDQSDFLLANNDFTAEMTAYES